MQSYDRSKVIMVIIYVVLIVGVIVGVWLLVSAILTRDDTIVGIPGKPFLYRTLDESKVEIFHPAEVENTTLFVFSASCPHCVEAAGQWNNLIDEDGEHTGALIGISLSPAEETATFMMQNQTRFPVILAGAEFMDGYDIHGTPTTITLHNGIVDLVASGPLDEATMEYLVKLHRKEAR